MIREEAIARIKDHKIVHKMNEPRAIYISEALDMAIEALEQEPKTGHWIIYKDCEGKTRQCTCDQCGYKTGKYTWHNPNFCANCGARMVEPQGKER